jgi:hypothetical protein
MTVDLYPDVSTTTLARSAGEKEIDRSPVDGAHRPTVPKQPEPVVEIGQLPAVINSRQSTSSVTCRLPFKHSTALTPSQRLRPCQQLPRSQLLTPITARSATARGCPDVCIMGGFPTR